MQAILLGLLAVAVSGVLPSLGGWLHTACLAGAVGLLAWALWRGRGAWRLPTRYAAIRRLENQSGVLHRPLQALTDRPLQDDPVGLALWHAHQRQLARRLDELHPAPPASRLAQIDRYAWRAGAALALVVALAVAGGDWANHLQRSLKPRLASASNVAPIVDLWIDPPAYTRKPPVYAGKTGEAMRVPAGSQLEVRVTAASRPALDLLGHTHALTVAGPDSHRLTLTVAESGTLTVSDGRDVLGSWPLTAIEDLPPTAAFAAPPEPTPRRSLWLRYTLADDYGVAQAWVEIRLASPTATDQPLRLPIPLANAATSLKADAFFDLTPHPWAGKEVTLRLLAEDAVKQVGASEPAAFVLPEREFNHPVAREIIAERKAMDDGKPHRSVSMALGKIAQYPSRFADDSTVFLGLRVAAFRLWRSMDDVNRAGVRDLLWDLALHVEHGELSNAERSLRTAQEALKEALNRGADPAEIARLVEDLRQAMRRFADQLADLNDNGPPPQMGWNGEDQVKDVDLEAMLDRIQALADSGANQAARDLLSQLQQMLEHSQAPPRMTVEQRQQVEAMTQMLNQMMEMARREQALLDQTFQRVQAAEPKPNGPPAPTAGQPQPFTNLRDFLERMGRAQQTENPSGPKSPADGQPGDPDQMSPMPELAEQQQMLRLDLGELMHRMGTLSGAIPMPLQQAEQAMRDATGHLRQGSGQQSLTAEAEALAKLREGSQALAQQLSRQMGTTQGNAAGLRFGRGERRPGQDQDPLGREGTNGQNSDPLGVRIPTETEAQKARRIRNDLFRRSADQERSAPEQNYLQRLLDQF